jgi:4-hydroxy-L-threonine phosphate dehydrogenase PdxA
MTTIAVIDGQGGGIGSHIVRRLREELPSETDIVALGTNAVATQAMMKAKANRGASGENAIMVTATKVDALVGALTIVIPHSMMGEVSPAVAAAIAEAEAPKFLLPLRAEGITLAGYESIPFPHLIDSLVEKLKARFFAAGG